MCFSPEGKKSMINEAVNDSTIEELHFLQNNRSFLGREFLTWLWFKSESQNNKLTIGKLGTFHFFIDDKIVLSSTSGSVLENSLKGGSPAYASEAGMALSTGKLVHEAKFILQDSERQWSFSVMANDLSIRGIRLPPVVESDSQSHISKRIIYAQFVTDVIDELFKEFMNIRTSSNFSEELLNIRKWMTDKIN